MSIADEARAEAEKPEWRDAWRAFQDERLLSLDPDGPGWPSRFECFVAGHNAGASRKPEAAPSDTDREALALGLAKYGPEWWGTEDVRHMVSNIVETPDADRGSIAHEMWSMGAWLDHPKCRNNPKHGNDADYENGCAACQQYLLVVADAILASRTSQPVQVEATDALVAQSARAAYVADNYWGGNPGREWDEGQVHDHVIGRYLRVARAALSVLGGGE